MTTIKGLSITTVMLAITAVPAAAQTATGPWTGGYLAVQGGAALQRETTKTIRFDTNLDGTFGDTVRTAAGADAFSPGFCAGIASSTTPASGCTADRKGSDFGGRAGYDWQRGAWVFGALVEYTHGDSTDTASAFSTTPARYSMTRDLKWIGAARARVGYAADRVLIYGTGGGATGNFDHSFSTSNTANTFTTPKNESMAYGYQAGGGLELWLTPRVAIGAEYIFTSLSDDTRYIVRAQGPAPITNPFILTNASGTDFQRDDRFKLQTVRATLAIRF